MKFSLDRDTFAKVLKKIYGVCSNKGSFAILGSCMINAHDDNITVSGTDLDITLRVIESAHVIENGVIVINARRLLDTVQNQIQGSEILVTSDSDNYVKIESGNFKARILTDSVSEFPAIPDMKTNASLTMEASALKCLIDKTMISISRDESRTDFTGALLKISQNGCIQMVSTDGSRLSRAESSIKIHGDYSPAFVDGVIVPRKGLAEIAKNLSDGGNICFDMTNGKIIIEIGLTIFYINLIAGKFPDFSKIFPMQYDHRAVVRCDSFQQMLKRSSNFSGSAGYIRLTMKHGMIEISTYDEISGGEMADFVDAEYEGSGVSVGFNWRNVDELLGVIDGEYAAIEVIDNESPVVIRDIESDKYEFLVMPILLR